jgi:glycosyltransferase involved in cell wall biosynthesis
MNWAAPRKRDCKILMLLSDGFGGFGGIAKFNRDFLEALDACPEVVRINALPRLISEAIDEEIPESVVYDRRSATGKIGFLQRWLARTWQDRQVDLVICAHIHLLPPAWLFARVSGARLALIIHGIEAWGPSRSALANRAVGAVDSVIAVSRLSADRFCSWSKVPSDRTFILSNCVDLERFKPQPQPSALAQRYGLQSDKVIFTFGRLDSRERYKGFDEVIEALPRLIERFPTLKYLVAGDGPDRPRLEAKARTLGVADRVVFAGRVAESEKVAHYNLADAYVMPSSGEGFGIVLIEAAACGIPVIGSRIDGSREALLDGDLGVLVDPKKPDELVDAVTSVLKNGSHRTRSDAIERFSVGNFRARVDEWLSRQLTASR